MATTGFSFLDLLKDKNFQNLLAGVGAGLDPEGVGGALGKGTIAYNKALASQAAAKTTLERNATAEAAPSALKSVIDTPAAPVESLLDTTTPAVPKLSYAVKEPTVLADEVADLLTPPDVPGPTSIARDKSGAVNMKYTPQARPSLLQADEVSSLLGDYLPPRTTTADFLETDYTQPRRLLPVQVASLDSQSDMLASLGPTIAQRAASQNVPEATAKRLDTYSTKHSVDPNLSKAIAMQESSGYHTDADGKIKVSSKGARGTMQLMPKTAARLGVDPDNEEQNLEGGVREIANLQKLSKNPKDILAGYYGGEDGMRLYQSQKATTPKGKEVLADINRYVEATYARYERMQGQTKVADLTGTTPTGIPLVDKVIEKGRDLIDLTTSGTQADRDAATARRRQRERETAAAKDTPSVLSPGTAEASTPSTQSAPKSQQTQLDEILGLPIATEAPPHLRIPIEKKSPPAKAAPQLTQLAPRAVREQYDLRGLSPDEVDKVVNRAIEAERNDIARSVDKRENTQLIETDDGYLVLNKRTREITPLTREGKLDAAKDLQLKRYDTLSEFTREMSKVPGTDPVVRSKMTDSQSKDFAYGSRALQANERQRKLEQRQAAGKGDDPEKFATKRSAILQTLEALPADMSMNIVGQILEGASLLGAGTRATYEKWIADNPKANLEERTKFLTTLGLGAAEARAEAIIGNRLLLTPDEREYMQNSIEFSTALLRRDSGAAVAVNEYLNTQRQYFASIGDKRPDVLRKLRARQTAIRGFRSSAGRPLLPPDLSEYED